MKAIKSVLANRKMFRGGGLVPTGNPMQNRNQASGILSSSDSLIDAVANDALSTQGGPTLSMNQGGVARFDIGGFNNLALTEGDPGSLPISSISPISPMAQPSTVRSPDMDDPYGILLQPAESMRGPSMEVKSLTPDLNTAVPTFGLSDMPISFDFKLEDVRTVLGQQQDVGQVDALVERIFPSDLQPGRLAKEWTEAKIARSESPEAVAARAKIIGYDLGEPESGRMSRVTENILRSVSSAKEGASEILGPAIDHAKAWAEYQFSGDTRHLTQDQVYWINEMVQRRPDLQADVEAFARQSVQGGPKDIDQFKHDIASSISKKYEDTGPYTKFTQREGRADPDYSDVGADPQLVAERLQEEKANAATYGSTLAGVDVAEGPSSESVWVSSAGPTLGGSQEEVGFLKAEMGDTELSDENLYRMWKGGRDNPDLAQGFARLTAALGDDTVDRFEQRLKRETEPSEEVVAETDTEVTDTESGLNLVTADRISEEGGKVDQESLVEGLAKHGDLVARRQMDLGKKGTLRNEAETERHDTLFEGVREAANTGTAEETKDKLQLYIDEFKGAMPDYEGKSEWEQGMDIVKMGMAIAAGQDPNAVTNIANGVLATIDNFTSDDKERREYKREVGFAAAKYGLDAVRNDLVQEREDERAIEWFYDKTKATEDMPHGSLVPISMADILSGEADLEFLEHPDIVERKISVLGEITEAGIKAKADAVKDRTITPTEGDKIEERFNSAADLFETSTAGMKAFNTVIEKVATNPDDYLGGKAEVKSVWGKAMVFAGVDPGKSWLDRKSLEADMKIGFQKLIINALKGVQSANSISNRDVEFLADAYISAGFLTPDGKGGFTFSTDLATQRPEILVQRLQSGIEIFRDGQQKALNAYDMNIEILSKANAEGRYGPQTYRGQIETLMPYAEVARMERAKDLGTMEYATAIGERPFYYEFDPEAGYKRLKGKEGSPFAGAFFSPTEENWAKFEGN